MQRKTGLSHEHSTNCCISCESEQNLLSTRAFPMKSPAQCNPSLVWLAQLRAVAWDIIGGADRMYSNALPKKNSNSDISRHATRVNVPLGMQTRFGLYTWGEGLGFGVGLSPSKLGPLRWNTSRGVRAACTLFTAGRRLLTVGGVLQVGGCCQPHLTQAVCSQHEAAVSRLQHTSLMRFWIQIVGGESKLWFLACRGSPCQAAL